MDRAYLLCFAGKVAMLGSDASVTVTELVQWAQRHLGLDQSALISFLGSVSPAIREFASLLKVDIGECPNYAGIIAAGCQELVRLSVEPAPIKTPAVQMTGEATISNGPRQPRGVAASLQSSNRETLPEFDLADVDALPDSGAQLNGYTVETLLGRGGMGVVLKAYDPALDRRIAIKMLRPEGVVRAEARERFLREARAVAAIQHENVVAIHAVSEIRGVPFLVMEYVPGMSLQDQLDRQGRLAVADIIRYGRHIASGLRAAHRRRVVHRDIKPANILIAAESAAAKITDFGLAQLPDQTRLSQEGTFVGTPQYMAPEQFAGEDIDHRADLFSLGSLLYTLCAGVPPFSGNTVLILMNQVGNKQAVPLRSLRPDLPAWLIELIGKLHAKSPAQRFQSADDVVRVFDKNA